MIIMIMIYDNELLSIRQEADG